jgi:serine/threonine protein kinase/tetratricopeptide (TPR) repeat protein
MINGKCMLTPHDDKSDETIGLPTRGASDFLPGLSAGRVLAGRFKIVRFLARGGMGEVYEAEDLELGENVALKTIRRDVGWEEGTLARFKQEIHLARKVTHPNVCRIFDVFHHIEASVDGPGQKITFLSMELLRGETLTERLRRAGPMTPDEALPLVRQMAGALAAAHKAGVIHRDFKSSNVILVPAGEEDGDVRVVVTDFGLARSSIGGQDLTMALSKPGEIRGTLAYMAPEQVAGEEITAAADVYALGLAMYEMLTGRLPFEGASGLAVAFERLKKAAPSPRTYVPGLDTRWETSILRCLERDPATRFQSFADLLQELEGEATSTSRTVEPELLAASQQPQEAGLARRRRASPLIAVSGIVTLVVLLGILLFQSLHRAPPGRTAARRSIAVLGFRNLTGEADAAWLSTALAEMLTTEMSAGEKLRAIPGENVARMKLELSLPDSSSFASDTLGRIRSYLGADVLISGSYLVLNGTSNKVRLDLRLQDSMTGELLTTVSKEGDAAQLLDLVSRTGTELREKLGIEKLGPAEAGLIQAALPANPNAARLYSEALEKLRLFDALGAGPLLEKALDADPNHALSHSALATSLNMLGYHTRAREEAKKAMDLSAGLPREERLLVEARYREAGLEWDQAVAVYQVLFGFFSDNLDYGLRLASSQTSAGKPKDALATIEALRKLPPVDGTSPRIDLAEARIAGLLSDFKHQRDLAANAAAKGQAQGARLLVAGARLLEGSALANLGGLEDARGAFADANRLYIAAGDRWDAANAETNLAYVLAKAGDSADAKKIYEDSLATYKELGDRGGTAAALTSMANLLRGEGTLLGARRMHEQALAIYREIADRAGEARALNNLANVFGLGGDLPSAQKTYEAALSVFREIGDRNGAATVLGNLADLLSERGELARAGTFYNESLDTFRDLGNFSATAYTLSRLGDLLVIKGDLAGARKKHEEALGLRTRLGEKGSVADSQLALAHISLLEGSPDAAEFAARAALDQFHKENRVDEEASATAVLARSLLAEDRNTEAKQAVERAEELASKSSNGSLHLSIRITAASVRAANGENVRAAKELAGVAAEARRVSLVALELEARLAMAQIDIASGHLEIARSNLESLEAEANRKGYQYIANRAAAARSKLPRANAPKNRI